MAYYIRDGEIIPVAVPLGKQVKIGSNYREPLGNYIDHDQLWLQDVYVFNSLPWYAIKNKIEKYMVAWAIWGTIFYVLTMIGRYLGAKPGWF